MATTLTEQESRWRSGKYVGQAKPVVRGFVRRGHLKRHYENKTADEIFCYIPGLKGPHAVWYSEWVPETDYMEIPTIRSVNGDQDFTQNGVEQVTISCDNTTLEQQSGTSGIFHTIERGFMSPRRGQAGLHGVAVGEENEWADIWNSESAQIMLVGGYGEAFFPLFLGLIDDVDLSGNPDVLTITARNMGKFVTDQRCFMDAKHLWVRDPITIADRYYAYNYRDVMTAVRAKSSNGYHPPRLARDDDDETFWRSEAHGNSGAQEWIEGYCSASPIHDIQAFPAFDGMEMYISVYATNNNVPGGGPAKKGNGDVIGEGWVNEGLGTVPGTSIPYVRKIDNVKGKRVRYALRPGGAGGYYVGDNSRVRLWFRDLKRVRGRKTFVYQAGLREMKIFTRGLKDDAKDWILVDDVSDIVKMVLQWCGFTPDDWEIESVGQRLSDKIVFDRQTFLVEIIKKIAEMTSYVFYVRPPETFDMDDLTKENTANLSMGIPVFRQNNAIKTTPIDRIHMIRDTDLLGPIAPKFSSAALSDSIRVRGRTIAKERRIGLSRAQPADQSVESFYTPLGADRIRRFNYRYKPVWARIENSTSARLRKPTVHYDELIVNKYQAKVACLMIAIRQALEAWKGQVEFPFLPTIHLDHQLGLYDTATATSTRLWVAKRQWEFQGGEQSRFAMTLGGSFIDTPEMQETREELVNVLNYRGYDPSPIARGPWLDPHFF